MRYDLIVIGAGPAGISSSMYAAGDIRMKQIRQVATAVSDGAIAGINAAAYILTHAD